MKAVRFFTEVNCLAGASHPSRHVVRLCNAVGGSGQASGRPVAKTNATAGVTLYVVTSCVLYTRCREVSFPVTSRTQPVGVDEVRMFSLGDAVRAGTRDPQSQVTSGSWSKLLRAPVRSNFPWGTVASAESRSWSSV